ncbi:hypothetical protein GTX14_25035 [Streptomyces sp. SID4944]|nr:hypothetical protein [Streptomyces sp. SID4944]
MDEDCGVNAGPVFDVGSLADAPVGAGLVTLDGFSLTQCNQSFREAFAGWDVGMRAGDVLTGDGFRALLDAIASVAGGGSARQVVVVPVDRAASDRAAPYRVVCCSRARSQTGVVVLLLVTSLQGPTAMVDPHGRSVAAVQALRRYEALLSAIPQVVWSMSAGGQVRVLVGREGDLGEFRSQIPTAEGWIQAVHPKDRAWFVPRWQATAEGHAILDAVVRIRSSRHPTDYRHVNIVAVPVMNDGEVREWIGTASDAETQWRSRMRERLLSRMMAVPAASDLRNALSTAADSVVPDLVDVFAVFQLRQGSQIGFDATRGIPLSVTRAGIALAEGLPDSPVPGEGFSLGPLALRTIEDQRVRRLAFPAGRPPRGELSDQAYAWMRRAGVTGLTVMPVVIEGRAVALAGPRTAGTTHLPATRTSHCSGRSCTS